MVLKTDIYISRIRWCLRKFSTWIYIFSKNIIWTWPCDSYCHRYCLSIVQKVYFYTRDHSFAISERSLLQCIMGYMPEILTAYGPIAPCKEKDFFSTELIHRGPSLVLDPFLLASSREFAAAKIRRASGRRACVVDHVWEVSSRKPGFSMQTTIGTRWRCYVHKYEAYTFIDVLLRQHI